jgi:hypothetical protein
MEHTAWYNRLWSAALVGGVCLLTWLLARHALTADSRLAVENALQLARPADIETITVFPLSPGPPRPFQLRTAAGIALLLPALRQLQVTDADPNTLAAEPLVTLNVRLTAPAQAAWHLRHRELIFRLASSRRGDIAQRAASQVVYQCPALGRQVRHLRDSIANGSTRR